MTGRSKQEAQISILKVLLTEGELIPTHLMYKANISYNRLQKLLTNLIERGLVTKKTDAKGKVTYVITESGIDAVWYARRTANHIGE